MKIVTVALLASAVSAVIAFGAGNMVGEVNGYGRGLHAGINRAMDMIAEENRKAADRPTGPDQIAGTATYSVNAGNAGDYISACGNFFPTCPEGRLCSFDQASGTLVVK